MQVANTVPPKYLQHVRASSPNGIGLMGDDGSSPWGTFWAIASTASMAASAYHGYKRNDSVGWAIGWGILGALFPVITPTIAVAQGYGKRTR